jgi:hypothetical protein
MTAVIVLDAALTCFGNLTLIVGPEPLKEPRCGQIRYDAPAHCRKMLKTLRRSCMRRRHEQFQKVRFSWPHPRQIRVSRPGSIRPPFSCDIL